MPASRNLFFKPRSGLIVTLGLLPVFISRGQEALRSAQSADAAIDSQAGTAVAPRPDSLHAGPVFLNLGAYVGTTFDDNINASQTDPQSEVSIHTGLSLGFLWPATDKSQIQFGSQFGYVTYLEHTRSDSIEIAPDSALTWSLPFEDGSVALYDQFDYSQEVITVPSVTGLNSLPRLENTVGVRAQWSPRKWQWELGLSHNDFRSTDSAFEYLDRGSEYIFLRGAWCFGESTQAGFEFSASQTGYRLPIQSNNRSYSIGPYMNWKITEFLNANVSGGPTIYNFDATKSIAIITNTPTVVKTPASTLTSYYFDFELTHQLTEFVSHQLSARRDVSLGYNQGNNYTELFSTTYSVNWQAVQNANLNLALTYQLGTQPLFPDIKENFSRFGISAGASYRLTEKLGSSMSYSHWERSSNLAGHNYSENSVSFQLNYSF
jgi:hypothetical protein